MADQPPPFQVVGAGPLTASERALDEWAERVDDQLLDAYRSLAKSWSLTLSTLLGLLGAGSLLGADAAVRALRGAWQVVFGLLAGGALGAAAFAILAAHTAAQPVEIRDLDPTLESKRAEYTRLVARSRLWLRWSRRATAIALLLLAGSFAIRWFAPIDA